jgi:hypothetical protein
MKAGKTLDTPKDPFYFLEDQFGSVSLEPARPGAWFEKG